jgi:hypothetical protein
MTSNRHRNAWIWVAITAIALATVARAQSGYEIARAYANPVIVLLSSAPDSQPFSAQHFAQKRTAHGDQAISHSNSGASFWLELLPVLFVGLVSPLSLLSTQSLLSVGRAYPAPPLTALFQRPPPAQLL